jgi:hypothetical protein
MKCFTISGVLAIAFLATAPAGSQAQVPKVSASPSERAKAGQKYAVADLAVVEFSGAYDGKNYNVGGTVKNIGHSEYTRTRAVNGATEGRQIQLFAVNPLKIGKALKLLRTVAVPSLKAGKTWNTPTMTVSPHDVPGAGNAKFVLMLTAGDADRDNDSKKVEVSLVR